VVNNFVKAYFARWFQPNWVTGERKADFRQDQAIGGLLGLALMIGIVVVIVLQKPSMNDGPIVIRKLAIVVILYFAAWLSTYVYRYKHQRLFWQLYNREQAAKHE